MSGYDKYLEFQYRWSGDFYKALWDAISRADRENTTKLEKAYPEEVDAYRLWTQVGPEALAVKLDKSHPLYKQFAEEYGLEGE